MLSRQLQYCTVRHANASAVVLEMDNVTIGWGALRPQAPVWHEFGSQQTESSGCPRRLGRDEHFVGDYSVHQISINYQMGRPRHTRTGKPLVKAKGIQWPLNYASVLAIHSPPNLRH
jgi:hypothetical protein